MKKSSPTSIRFREDYFKYAKEKEKLETPQQVVDFLLEKYWWEHNGRRVTTETIVAPPMADDRQSRQIERTEETLPQMPLNDIVGHYKARLSKSNSYEEIAAIMKEAEKDTRIGYKIRGDLNAYAKTIRLDY